MSNLSDKEIDRLSREAADSYEPDHTSLSWSRLEQKLTEQMPGRPPDGFRFGRINPYIWGPAVVLIAGLSFFLIKNLTYRPHSTRTNLSAVKSISSKADNPVANENSVPASRASALKAMDDSITKREEVPNQPTSSNGKGSKNQPSLSSDLSKSAKVLHGNGIQTPNDGDKSKSDPAGEVTRKGAGSKYNIPASATAATSMAMKGSGSSGKINSNSISPFTDKWNATTGDATSNNEIPGPQRSVLTLPRVVSSGAGLIKVKGNDSLLNRHAPNSPVPHKSLRINRSLNFGFAFGPDYSNAGGIANNQISNNIGITIGYYLTSKLSVNSGIFYSNKFYWSPGKSNHPQVNPVPPVQTYAATYAALPPVDFVNGSCNMYELPLTLRYDVAKSEKTKFFVNAGLSSYFMMKQTYIYFFHNGQRPQAWKTTNNQQVNYWFSVADLSVGLETDMGKGFSFQAEPFLRLPLKNMGVQNVKINSYGFLLSFRYSPVLSRSKR